MAAVKWILIVAVLNHSAITTQALRTYDITTYFLENCESAIEVKLHKDHPNDIVRIRLFEDFPKEPLKVCQSGIYVYIEEFYKAWITRTLNQRLSNYKILVTLDDLNWPDQCEQIFCVVEDMQRNGTTMCTELADNVFSYRFDLNYRRYLPLERDYSLDMTVAVAYMPYGSDTNGCPSDQYFQCSSDSLCIPSRFWCDSIAHCSDESDEKDCEESKRPPIAVVTSSEEPDPANLNEEPIISAEDYSSEEDTEPGTILPDSTTQPITSKVANAERGTSQRPLSASTSQIPPSTSTSQRPPSASTSQRPPFASTTQRPPSASTTQRPPSASTSRRPPFASTSRRPPFASTSQRPPSASTTQRPSFASTTQRPSFASTSQRPPSTSTTQRPPSTSTTQRPPSTSTTQRPPSTSTTQKATTTPSAVKSPEKAMKATSTKMPNVATKKAAATVITPSATTEASDTPSTTSVSAASAMTLTWTAISVGALTEPPSRTEPTRIPATTTPDAILTTGVTATSARASTAVTASTAAPTSAKSETPTPRSTQALIHFPFTERPFLSIVSKASDERPVSPVTYRSSSGQAVTQASPGVLATTIGSVEERTSSIERRKELYDIEVVSYDGSNEIESTNPNVAEKHHSRTSSAKPPYPWSDRYDSRTRSSSAISNNRAPKQWVLVVLCLILVFIYFFL